MTEEKQTVTADPDPEGCFGCHDRDGYVHRHSSYFVDSRTGRQFCHECTSALVSWELDRLPGDDGEAYVGWLGDGA